MINPNGWGLHSVLAIYTLGTLFLMLAEGHISTFLEVGFINHYFSMYYVFFSGMRMMIYALEWRRDLPTPSYLLPIMRWVHGWYEYFDRWHVDNYYILNLFFLQFWIVIVVSDDVGAFGFSPKLRLPIFTSINLITYWIMNKLRIQPVLLGTHIGLSLAFFFLIALHLLNPILIRVAETSFWARISVLLFYLAIYLSIIRAWIWHTRRPEFIAAGGLPTTIPKFHNDQEAYAFLRQLIPVVEPTGKLRGAVYIRYATQLFYALRDRERARHPGTKGSRKERTITRKAQRHNAKFLASSGLPRWITQILMKLYLLHRQQTVLDMIIYLVDSVLPYVGDDFDLAVRELTDWLLSVYDVAVNGFEPQASGAFDLLSTPIASHAGKLAMLLCLYPILKMVGISPAKVNPYVLHGLMTGEEKDHKASPAMVAVSHLLSLLKELSTPEAWLAIWNGDAGYFARRDPVLAWQLETGSLLAEGKVLGPDYEPSETKSGLLTGAVYVQRLTAIIARGELILANATSVAKPSILRDLDKLRGEITLLKARMNTPLKIQPFAVAIYGASRAGKSSWVMDLAQVALATLGMKFEQHMIWNVNAMNKFADGLTTAHCVYWFDEFGAVSANVAKPENTSHKLFLEVVNNVRTAAVMADVESKGKLYHSPLVTIATTNVWDLNAGSLMAHPVALYNRFNAFVQLRVKPKFESKTTPGAIDPDLTGDQFSNDYWDYDVCVSKGVTDADPWRLVKTFDRADKYTAYLSTLARAHFKKQVAFVAKRSGTRTLCRCGGLLDLGKHDLPECLGSDLVASGAFELVGFLTITYFTAQLWRRLQTIFNACQLLIGIWSYRSTVRVGFGWLRLVGYSRYAALKITIGKLWSGTLANQPKAHVLAGVVATIAILVPTAIVLRGYMSSKAFKASGAVLSTQITAAPDLTDGSGTFSKVHEVASVRYGDLKTVTNAHLDAVGLSKENMSARSEHVDSAVQANVVYYDVAYLDAKRKPIGATGGVGLFLRDRIMLTCAHTFPTHAGSDKVCFYAVSLTRGNKGAPLNANVETEIPLKCVVRYLDVAYVELPVLAFPNMEKFVSYRMGQKVLGSRAYMIRRWPDGTLGRSEAKFNIYGSHGFSGSISGKFQCQGWETTLFPDAGPGWSGAPVLVNLGNRSTVVGVYSATGVETGVSLVSEAIKVQGNGVLLQASWSGPEIECDWNQFPEKAHHRHFASGAMIPLGFGAPSATFQSKLKYSILGKAADEVGGKWAEVLNTDKIIPDDAPQVSISDEGNTIYTVGTTKGLYDASRNLMGRYSLFRQAGDWYFRSVINRLKKPVGVGFTPLGVYEGVNGRPDAMYIDRVKLRTSAGYPHVGKTKRDLTRPLDELGNVELLPEVREKLDQAYVKVMAGEMSHPPFVAFGKDEPRAPGKRIRAICCPPFWWIVLCRMFFLPIVAFVQSNRSAFRIAVGMNITSDECGSLVRSLVERGADLCDDGDQPKFDKTQSAEVEEVAFEILCQIGVLFGKGFDEVLPAMHAIALDCIYYILGVRSIWYLMLHSNPSGQPLTAILNSIVAQIYKAAAYIVLGRSFEEYERDVHWTYGDDAISSCSVAHDDMVRAFKSFGQNYTDAQKKDLSYKFKNVGEIVFLQRRFRFDADLKMWVAPLEYSSMGKEMRFRLQERNNGDSNEYHATQIVRDVQRQFLLRGKAEFEDFQSWLRAVALKAGVLGVCEWPSYDELAASYSKGELVLWET